MRNYIKDECMRMLSYPNIAKQCTKFLLIDYGTEHAINNIK